MAAIQANCRDYLTELSAPRDDDLKVKFVSNFNQLGLEDKNTRDTCFDRGKNFALKLHNSKDLQGFHSRLCLDGNSSGN